ncbi:MAG TPA: hypothetical protein VNS12_13345 [Pelagibacterium sp.]|uniref:hypothetical protein n=1 Tax=Pelagibacterium sp. TaxID=1967288 RepID=UPI002C5FEA9E|nr:hypothetical protein [Pelagibacterium sp.]HWJ89047.1 hypothetical protein [Pelagibacterium sp.]
MTTLALRSGHWRPTLSEHDRQFLRALPWGLLAAAATLALCWPLRFDGEMIWVALAAL